VLLSAKYFAAIPAIFSLMAAACFAMGAISLKKSIAAVAR
jgi:high-affinity K+ transport system ATPase subunit B